MNRDDIPDSHGSITQSVMGDGGLGSAFTVQIPTNSRRRIIALRVTLIADATVTTRNVFLEILSGATSLGRIFANLNQTAGQTITYNFIAGGPDRAAAIQGEINVQLPMDFWFDDNFTVQVDAVNLQAGDNFSSGRQLTEEWTQE